MQWSKPALAVLLGSFLTLVASTALGDEPAPADAAVPPVQETASAAPVSDTPASDVPATQPEAAPVTAPLIAAGLAFDGIAADQTLVLLGADARAQLVLTATMSDNSLRDFTRQVSYSAEPAGIVEVDSTGHVKPLADGATTVTATSADGVTAQCRVEVKHYSDPIPVNFPNQIVPIFTKLGCNSGGCHGKASGQNGFKLSLLGFEPTEDYEYLVKEARGRRLFLAAPERSLLLEKATNQVPHGGGQRLQPGSYEYGLIRRWISQGVPYGNASDPVVERIETIPAGRSMQREAEQQIRVLAYYTNGNVEDVTRIAQYDPNQPEMAECSVTGLVRTLDLAGDVAFMARYQGQVAVFRASIPLGAPVSPPPRKNFVDELVFGKQQTLGIPASELCDDASFIRRASIDIAGRLPLPEETQAFLADTSGDKRARLIEQLLDSPGYADYFANKWGAVLRNRRQAPDFAHGTFAFHSWIRQSLYENKPYDQFVREIVAAAGEPSQHPPVVWYRELKDVNQQVEDTAQLFLGMRIQCARCHHHPFEKWSQQDYYGFAAFFSQVGRKPAENPTEQKIFHKRGVAQAKNPKNGQEVKPTGLGSAPLEIAADRDPRQALADWMRAPENPFFAPALVNRYWKHFFDRGLVDPEDDMRVTNPAANPELLDALARHFVEKGFDLKNLVRTICNSQAYQLSSQPNEHNLTDKQNFSRYYPKRLTAEVLLDAINQVTLSSTDFSDLPVGTRAVQLPDQASNSYFLTVFGRPQAETACECERSQEANLAQSLHLLNSAEVQGKLTAKTGRAALLAADAGRTDDDKLRELYLLVYSREPVAEELEIAKAHLNKATDKQQAYEDLIWALLNTKEFLFNH